MPSLILPKKHLSIDIETFSSVDIRKSGAYKYIQSDDFEILLLSYSIDFGEVQTIDLTDPDYGIPTTLTSMMHDQSVIKHAYNAMFEYYALNRFFGALEDDWFSPIEQWQDTMIHGLYCGLTAGLDVTAKVLGLPQDKQKLSVGRNLIKIFCTPTTPTQRNGNRLRTLPHHEPEKWQLFKDYNRQDVAVEMEIEKRLSRFPVPEDVWQQWRLDMQINAHGIQLDSRLIAGALHIDQVTTEALKNEAKQLTGLSNPNSAPQLTKWLSEQGIEVENLQKDTVSDLVKTTTGRVKRVLEIRQQLSKTSIKKYKAMADAFCKDGRVRGLLQFYGANRSGREAGRLVQVQNLSKNHMPAAQLDLAREIVMSQKPNLLDLVYGNTADTLSQLVRTAFIAAPGHQIVVADFKAIEARVIAWLSKEEWRLDVFRTHEKIYEASASQMFGVPVESISHGDPVRQQGKVAELASGYGGGIGAMKRMDFGGDIRPDMSDEAMKEFAEENNMSLLNDADRQLVTDAMIDANYLSIVQRWRRASPSIVRMWHSYENAALSVMRTGRTAGANDVLFARESDVQNGLDFLTITLPSKRKLYYAHPFLASNQFDQESLWYFGMDQTTHKWVKISTYGGKLTENICQAIARDCLFYAMENLAKAGYQTVMTIHDEVVLDVSAEKADLDQVVAIMKQPIEWAPGLPLNADGFVNDYYKKDD